MFFVSEIWRLLCKRFFSYFLGHKLWQTLRLWCCWGGFRSFCIFAFSICMHLNYWLINYIDTKAKCRHLKKLTCQGTLRQVSICLRPSPLLGFCLGWSSNFVGSESGQVQSAKLLKNMISNRNQRPHPLPATQCLFILYFYTGKGGKGREFKRREG